MRWKWPHSQLGQLGRLQIFQWLKWQAHYCRLVEERQIGDESLVTPLHLVTINR
jgi:hypothetical protein